MWVGLDLFVAKPWKYFQYFYNWSQKGHKIVLLAFQILETAFRECFVGFLFFVYNNIYFNLWLLTRIALTTNNNANPNKPKNALTLRSKWYHLDRIEAKRFAHRPVIGQVSLIMSSYWMMLSKQANDNCFHCQFNPSLIIWLLSETII